VGRHVTTAAWNAGVLSFRMMIVAPVQSAASSGLASLAFATELMATVFAQVGSSSHAGGCFALPRRRSGGSPGGINFEEETRLPNQTLAQYARRACKSVRPSLATSDAAQLDGGFGLAIASAMRGESIQRSRLRFSASTHS
jgi:hypothetical protein